MAWFDQFLLGRPGYEIMFEVNPESMSIDEAPVTVLHRNLAGDLKKSVLRTSFPLITIQSSYLTLNQRNLMASLAGTSDTFLSFKTRNYDWTNYDVLITPASGTTLILDNNSATKLSAVAVAAGYNSTIKPLAVMRAPYFATNYGYSGYGGDGYGGGGDGINYLAGGVYDDATRTLTVGRTLPNLSPVYVSYSYPGWLVNMEKLAYSMKGGWMDRFNYSFQLTGA